MHFYLKKNITLINSDPRFSKNNKNDENAQANMLKEFTNFL